MWSCLTAPGRLVDVGAIPAADFAALPVIAGATATCPPGDLNHDGRVNILDLSSLIGHYGQPATASGAGTADINWDGIVDSNDLTILVANYGRW